MNTNIETTRNLDIFSTSLLKEVEKYNEYIENQIDYYTFKSTENHFSNILKEETKNELKGFKILTKLQRFFYTYENVNTNENETIMTNVIVSKDEKLSFYKDGELMLLEGKTEFTYDELINLSKIRKGMNKKIIIIGILDGKLTKIESSYTSENSLFEYLSKNGFEKSADIKGEERKTRNDKTYNILSFRVSEKQKHFTNEELLDFKTKLSNEFNRINKILKEGKDEGIKVNNSEKTEEEFYNFQEV